MIQRQIDLVSPNVKRYIENRVKYLTCNPLYHISRGTMDKSKLEEEANRHSVSVEMVDFNITTSDSRHLKAQEKKRCEESLKVARAWAKKYFTLPLSREYIAYIGQLVDPLMNPKGFRTDSVRISNSRCSPPSPEKLDRELNIFLWENESIKNPLERAIHAHLGIARVHPFNDGNGRTSRLVQDVILSDEGLPLPMIPLFERPEYIQRIEEAIASHYEKEGSLNSHHQRILADLRELASDAPSLSEEQVKRGKYLSNLLLSLRVTPEQNAFYDFIALKVLCGLSDSLKRLYPSESDMIKYFKMKKHNRSAAIYKDMRL